jgi:hypothetical protein
MLVDIEDFKTGWFGLSIGIKKNDVDKLIDALQKIKSKDGHFHLRSDYHGSGGVGDIEFFILDENETDNMKLDSSPSIYPEEAKT